MQSSRLVSSGPDPPSSGLISLDRRERGNVLPRGFSSRIVAGGIVPSTASGVIDRWFTTRSFGFATPLRGGASSPAAGRR
jgi:hypothetical protein